MTGVGIHHDLPAETYHAGPADRPALSASIAKKLLTHSPLHAWTAHPRLNPDWQPDERGTFDLGAAAHVLLLEGDRFAAKVATVDCDDWRTKAARAHRDAAREAGKIPMLDKDWHRTVEMVDAIRMQLDGLDVTPPMFAEGKPEVTLVWEEDGVLLKARLDWLHDDFSAIDDFKSSSSSANPHVWTRRTFWAIGCDVQAAFYARGVHALTGVWPAFRFLVAEREPPYAISALDLAPSAWELGQSKVDYAIAKWRQCLERDSWPAYPPSLASVETDGYQEADLLRLTYGEEVGA